MPTKQKGAIASLLILTAARQGVAAPGPAPDLAARVGQPVDIASSAYLYRADRPATANPPESWILLMQYAHLPFDKPVDIAAPAIKCALCGLLWEEVRPLRRLELSWPADAAHQPSVDDLVVACFDGTDQGAHTWWNPRAVKELGQPGVSADGRTYSYAVPVDTWGAVVALRGEGRAAAYAVPTVRALVPDVWKRMDVEVEWGYESSRAHLPYDGRVEAYDGAIDGVRPLRGDKGTMLTNPTAWRSLGKGGSRRGVRFSLLYMGTSAWRRVWPYDAQQEDVARTIVTVWTRSGSFSFLAADLEHGPILAPEYGFFVRATALQRAAPDSTSQPPFSLASRASSAREFMREVAGKRLTTIRSGTRAHAEQTWEGAVEAMGGTDLPSHPTPELEPAMQAEVPDARLTAQWKLGAWHMLRRSVQDERGRRRFNDYPFGVLASETYLILRALDLQGMHKEAADGLDQWLSLPL